MVKNEVSGTAAGIEWRKTVRRAVPAAALVVLAACSGGKGPAGSEGKPTNTPTLSHPNGMPVAGTLYADLSWFLLNDTTCQNGGPRPCGVRLRSYPAAVDSNVVNQIHPTDRVAYPLEAYGSQSAPPLDGVCELEGKDVKSGTPGVNQHTAKWYVVRLNEGYILNPAIKAQAESADPPFHVERTANGLQADVFMSAAWTRGHGSVVLPNCKMVELAQNRN